MAVILTVVLWQLKGAYNEQRTYNPAHQQETAQYHCVKVFGLTFLCYPTDEPGTAEPDRDDDDLRAQQEMADWAFGVVWVSSLGLLLSLVGLPLIYLTFRAARDGNRINQLTGEAQVRAYLQYEAFRIEYVTADNGTGIKITGKLTNRGQSPALVVKAGGLVSSAKPEITDQIDSRVVMSSVLSYMAPGLMQEAVSVTLEFKTFEKDFLTGNGSLWIAVIVTWADVFDKPQMSYFRGQLLNPSFNPLTIDTLKAAAQLGTIHVGNG